MNVTEPRALKRDTTRSRILAIDDEPTSHEVISAHLARENYELCRAENGAQGLVLAEDFQPDTILLDVMMPGIDGFETCRRLKAAPTLAHIPVILLTALDDRRYAAEGLNAGADEFISKPVVGDELRARVRSMLRIKKQHDELRRLMRLREDLVQMAVHDIRSPLNVVMTYGELLAQSGPLTPEQSLDLTELLRGADRVHQLVDDLLTLAKLEEGKLAIQRTRIELVGFVSRAVDMHRGAFARRHLNLALSVPQPPLYTYADANLLQRVLDNLLSNATKFSPYEGKVEVKLTAEPSGMRLLVTDAGPGVPEEHRRHIFDKFGIVELRRQNLPQFGLGLAFCKMAVEAHGGTISVADNQPHGAAFWVDLPAPEAAG